MDFLDSLDLDTHSQNDYKTERMRSWYLFEQYKSLEQNQLDAAQKLRNRSLEERLLHRELTERRARRRLYNDIETSQTCSHHKVHNPGSCYSTTEDLYESYCELHDFESAEYDDQSRDSAFMEDFKVLEESLDGTSCAECVCVRDDSSSDKEDGKNSQFAIADTIQSTQKTIAESIQRHLETVKQNMESLERFTRLDDGDVLSGDSAKSTDQSKPDEVDYKNVKKVLCDNQLFCLWSRFVIFAYQIVQLNHGNCYLDYSSQLLTAVLACDALCRGINRVCDILQSYVSPVKYSSDRSEAESSANESLKKSKSYETKKNRNSSKHKINSSCHKTYAANNFQASSHSGKLCCRHSHSRCSLQNRIEELRTGRLTSPSRYWHQADLASTCPTLWPAELPARRRRGVVDPMLRIVRQLDDFLTTDVDEFRDEYFF